MIFGKLLGPLLFISLIHREAFGFKMAQVKKQNTWCAIQPEESDNKCEKNVFIQNCYPLWSPHHMLAYCSTKSGTRSDPPLHHPSHVDNVYAIWVKEKYVYKGIFWWNALARWYCLRLWKYICSVYEFWMFCGKIYVSYILFLWTFFPTILSKSYIHIKL